MTSTKTVWWAIALAALAAGCGSPAEDDGPIDDIGEEQLPQIDPGWFLVQQSGATVGAAWKGHVGGSLVEYWAKKPSYIPAGTRQFVPQSGGCSTFKAAVCGSGWSGSARYQATFTEAPLSCSSRPTSITAPPARSRSFRVAASARRTPEVRPSRSPTSAATSNTGRWTTSFRARGPARRACRRPAMPASAASCRACAACRRRQRRGPPRTTRRSRPSAPYPPAERAGPRRRHGPAARPFLASRCITRRHRGPFQRHGVGARCGAPEEEPWRA